MLFRKCNYYMSQNAILALPLNLKYVDDSRIVRTSLYLSIEAVARISYASLSTILYRMILKVNVGHYLKITVKLLTNRDLECFVTGCEGCRIESIR